jgi:hypothetical protein
MANRRFEMHQYRHILARRRLGDTDRHLAKAGLVGRRKAAELRLVFAAAGWLDPAQPLPDAAAVAAALAAPAPTVSPNSSVLPYEEQILTWRELGVQGVAIHQALVRKHGFAGHYSSVRRFLSRIEKKSPKPTGGPEGDGGPKGTLLPKLRCFLFARSARGHQPVDHKGRPDENASRLSRELWSVRCSLSDRSTTRVTQEVDTPRYLATSAAA